MPPKARITDENISVIQGNALDLSAFSDNQYDITLLLGPLHHLYNKEDKQQAIREAIRVTKQDGIIFTAYVISDGCLLDEGFKRSNINVAEYIKNGLLDAETFAAQSQPKDLFELVRKEDVDALMSIFPTIRLHYVATDGCALFMREAIDETIYLKSVINNPNIIISQVIKRKTLLLCNLYCVLKENMLLQSIVVHESTYQIGSEV